MPVTPKPDGPPGEASLLATIASAVTERSAPGIARSISNLITSGTFEPDDQLPTVRAVAKELGVSSSTVSSAWRLMQNHGMIETDRRRGTRVRSTRGSIEGRYWQVPVPAGTFDIDLSTGTPDPALLPDIGEVLRRIHADVAVGSYLDAPVLPALRAELERRWPFKAQRLTVVDGAQDGLDRLVGSLVQIGDRVVVENPTFPPVLDMLELAGAEILSVGLDAHGLDLGQFEAALAQQPRAIVVQPRAQNPTGVTMDADRAQAIASMIPNDVWVIEDDHSGDAAGAPLCTISEHRLGRSVLIQSFSKSHGPDLRIAALGGSAEALRMVERRRSLGPSWTSRLLQQILVELLTDPNVENVVNEAASTYRTRRQRFVSAMALHGIDLPVGDGLNMSIPVRDEQAALVYLASQSVGAAPGRPFMLEPDHEFIRLSVASYDGDLDALAALVAAAAAL